MKNGDIMKKVTKESIIELLRKGGELNLTNIRIALGADNNTTPLHHLNGLIDAGKVRKTLNKTYRLVDVAGLPTAGIETIKIPLIIARAGPSDNDIESVASVVDLPGGVSSHNPDNLIMVKVDGSSMTPTFNNGDLLLFQRLNSTLFNPLKDKDIVLWRVDDGAKIKRLRWMMDDDAPYGLLLSDNAEDPNNRPIRIDDDNSSFIGKFLSVIRRA